MIKELEKKDYNVPYEYLIYRVYKEFGYYPAKIVRKLDNGNYISEFSFLDFFGMDYVKKYVPVKICDYYYYGFYSWTFGIECHLFDVLNKSLFSKNTEVSQENIRDLLMSISSIAIKDMSVLGSGTYNNNIFVGPECSDNINLLDNKLISLNGKVNSNRLNKFNMNLFGDEVRKISEDFSLKKIK